MTYVSSRAELMHKYGTVDTDAVWRDREALQKERDTLLRNKQAAEYGSKVKFNPTIDTGYVRPFKDGELN